MRDELQREIEERYPGARVERLAGDASTRRFYRLRPAPSGGDESSRVLMDYGEAVAPGDVAKTALLQRARLRVPEILYVFRCGGALLLEDLGDRTLEQAVLDELRQGPADSGPARGLYDLAVDLAADIAGRGTAALAAEPQDPARPRLDAARFRFEMDFFLEHYAGALMGRPADAGLRDALHDLADRAAAGSPVLCHRDYHSRNLMVLPAGSAADAPTLAMVDIQDALPGPDTYDLASLLRDAYVDLPEDWVEPLLRRFAERAGLEDAGKPSLRRRFDLVAAERMIKALGTFGFQATSRGQDRYLEGVPRTLRRLTVTLPRIEAGADLLDSLERLGLLTPPR